MALIDREDGQYPIRQRDLRTCQFYRDWLHSEENIRTDVIDFQDAEICRKAVNRLINRYFPDKEKQSRLLTEMDMACNENLLPAESFYWLQKDERATFWLWAYLHSVSDSRLGITPYKNVEHGTNWYQRIHLSTTPVSHPERLSLITSLFDKIIIPSPSVPPLKRQIMEQLKDKWKVIYSRPQPLKWLPDDEVSVLWAWDKLQKFQKNQLSLSEGRRFNFSEPGLTTWFTPFSHSERHFALRAALDIWTDAPDTKQLFTLNLNKSWNQHKLRQSRTDKKALNTYLKNETKIRLDLLAAHHDLRISDMLEKLINEHYRKTWPEK